MIAPEEPEDRERLELEAWVENQDGVKAAVADFRIDELTPPSYSAASAPLR